MGKAWRHFKTITYHRYLVAKGCFRVGLYRQGLLHDLSKYSPSEFIAGVRYFQGDRSPNDAQREKIGYSAAWLHHKGRNRHHYEYWIDYSKQAPPGQMVPVPMPDKYIAEMIMDRIAACKVYKGADYTPDAPLAYYNKGRDRIPMHASTKKTLEHYLEMLAQEGEERTFRRIREELVKGRKKGRDRHKTGNRE